MAKEIPKLGIDKFSKPIILDGNQSDAELILNLFMMRPGDILSNPDMGIGLDGRRFKIGSKSDISTFKREAQDQMDKYLPMVDIRNLEYDLINNDTAVIYIETDSMIIAMSIAEGDDGRIKLKDVKNSNL